MDIKALNIREVWNPVCCHGNKTGMLNILWSTYDRMLYTAKNQAFVRQIGSELSFFITVDKYSIVCVKSLKNSISLEEIFENSEFFSYVFEESF